MPTKMTNSMRRAITETHRRRKLQQEHNREHNIQPQTVRKAVTDILSMLRPEEAAPLPGGRQRSKVRDAAKVAEEIAGLPSDDLERLIRTLEEEMQEASAALRFEYAARVRDEIQELKRELRHMREAV